MTALLFGLFVALMALRVPIAMSIGGAVLAALAFAGVGRQVETRRRKLQRGQRARADEFAGRGDLPAGEEVDWAGMSARGAGALEGAAPGVDAAGIHEIGLGQRFQLGGDP